MQHIINLRFLIFLTLLFSLDSCNVTKSPENIDKAIIELDNIFTNEQKLIFKNQEESLAVFEIYKGLGREIHYSWFIVDGPQREALLKQFFDLGVHDSETMMKIILKSYHRKLNGKQVNYVQQIEEYKKLLEINRMKRIPEMMKEIAESNYKKIQVGDEIEIYMYVDYSNGNKNVITDNFVNVAKFDPEKDLRIKAILTEKKIDSAKYEKSFKVKINYISLSEIKYLNRKMETGQEYIFNLTNLRVKKHYR